MGEHTKIRLAAKIMLAKFGKAAATVARLRARRSARYHDEEAVQAWTAVARAASSAPSRRKSKADASLDDIAQSQVEREDGERLVGETKKVRESSEK